MTMQQGNVSARRHWVSAVILALVLGPGLVTQASADESDPVVATVNDHDIRRSEVFASIESFPLDQQLNMRKRIDLVIQSMVNEELLFQYALTSTDKWDKQLRQDMKSAVAEKIIERHVRGGVHINDDDIRKYYQQHRDTLRGWHVRVRHIRLKQRKECEAMLLQMDSEETFARMAEAHSLDRVSAGKGGDLGYMMYSPNTSGSLGFELEFFEMQLNEMRIFESAKGCHLVRVVEIDDPEDPPFEKIRAFLRPKLEAQEERRLLESFLKMLARDANVFVAPKD
jgi:parvulin-like peptidyl-prolyl isomerase